jgi:hypothetical protein
MAIDRVVLDGHGTLIDELRIVSGWVRDGQPVARALRRWVVGGGGGGTAGRVAVAAASAASTEELAQRLAALADELHDQAHDERLAATQRSARLAWIASAFGLVVAVTTVLARVSP